MTVGVPQAPEPFDAVQAIATRPDLRDAVRAATARGVSPSRFFGRPVVVEHELDLHGRVVRSLYDADWTDDDRALVLAFDAWDAARCGGCGMRLAETTDRDHEEQYAVTALRCHACTAIAVEAPTYRDHPNPAALRFYAALRTPSSTDPEGTTDDDPAVDAG